MMFSEAMWADRFNLALSVTNFNGHQPAQSHRKDLPFWRSSLNGTVRHILNANLDPR
jgi:hypothetical protein